jgi:hypothetical protein
MSMDPATMQQMLTQSLIQQPPQAGAYGGGAAGPQMQGSISPVNAAANLTQKLMLMKALQAGQQRQQQVQANSMLPGTQNMVNQQLPGMTNQINPNMPPPPGLPTMQPSPGAPPVDPSLLPTPGYS